MAEPAISGGGSDGEPELTPAQQAAAEQQAKMRREIMKIMMDSSLSDAEKAQRRQDLMSGKWAPAEGAQKEDKPKAEAAKKGAEGSKKQDLLEDTLKCVICFNLCERPVTGPCQHNFCLACFKRWLGQGKKTCPTCRTAFPPKFIENPRINTLLTYAIRCAKQGIKNDSAKPVARIADESRPAEAFTTERAVRAGRANAASGRIMVSVPNDHFGPILPEHDPVNAKGVQVGDWWKDRLDCRQWGAHFPHVAGIAGQSNRGAQSVVLSGGYEDDHDEGEWFLYTGSGGRDLSGNKRTNKNQSFDQEFEAMNKALKISCLRGLPVRVVRSYKEKRSSYAPSQETPVRYDGIYRILRCWRKKGAQGYLMCRYLFVRCDNAPAPWTSEERGDALRLDVPGLAADEIAAASGTVFAMAESPYWDFDADKGEWGWARDAPPSQKAPGGGDTVKKLRKKASAHERLLKDFACGLCKGVLDAPLSMPCGHNFCKACLDARFAAAAEAAAGSKALADAKPARSLRVRKVAKPCPTCKTDISDYMATAAVNTEMAALIKRLQQAAEEARAQADEEAAQVTGDAQTNGAAAAGKAAAAAAGSDEDEADEAAAEASSEGEEQPGSQQAEEDEDAAGPSSRAPPQKRRRVAAPAKQPEPEQQQPGEQPEPEQQPAAAEAAAPPAANGASAPAAAPGGRYAAELAQLTESFPEFDAELIMGLLEDQGGDVDEVHAYLKRMKNQLAYASRKTPKQGGSKAKGSKGKGSKKQAADEADEADEEQQPEAEAPPAAAAAAGNGADTGMAEAGAGGQSDTQPESDVSSGRKAAAAQDKEGATDGAAAGAAAGGKKRRASASSGGSKASKRRAAAK